MAFSSPKKNGNRRVVISEINITPFVDVLLVLLIIFMIAAPMLTSSVDVNLPQGVETANNEKLQTLTVSIKADSTIYLQDDLIKFGILGSRLKEISGNNLTRKIFVRADKDLDYGKVMEVVKTVSQAGFSQVVLVTEIPK
ncbi:MAG: biopolymer transporter ExbD [Proteobacteria bacterium]|nr:biopolymer transporter ExbD [Pseudomonadota bacterium]NCA28915.1 biopolymer transporter ExbD [Pseudomonadota bacterium]